MSPEQMRAWAALLNRKVQKFSIDQSPRQAMEILAACICIEKAVTSFLTKYQLEDVIDGANHGSK